MIIVNQQHLNSLIVSFTGTDIGNEKLIIKDVNRTNFVKKYKQDLTKLLKKVSKNFPKTGYYQGMNCIGGFLLEYTGNYKISLTIYNYLLEKLLNKYFAEKFKNTKQLFYVCEKLFELYLPNFYMHLEKLNIRSGEYLVQLSVTLLTGSLQYIQNFSLVANIFDVVIAENWPGFFKILIVVFSRLEHIILKLNHEKTLAFLQREIYDELIQFNFKSLKKEISKLKIPKNLLITLEYQYVDTAAAVENFWKEYYDKRRSTRRVTRK